MSCSLVTVLLRCPEAFGRPVVIWLPQERGMAGAQSVMTENREQRWLEYVEGVRRGNAEVLACLYNDTSPLLYGLAMRMLRNPADAEEVLMDVFQQVWRTAHTFDPARGTVWRWLALLTRSRAVDRLRAMAQRREREQPAGIGYPDPSSQDPGPDTLSIYREQQILVRDAMNELSREQRQAIEMAWFSELTHVEIAATLGLPLGTIKTRIRVGMGKLRNALAPNPTHPGASIS